MENRDFVYIVAIVLEKNFRSYETFFLRDCACNLSAKIAVHWLVVVCDNFFYSIGSIDLPFKPPLIWLLYAFFIPIK